jgi:ribosomal protein S18 acetylase RimI-like enzyme
MTQSAGADEQAQGVLWMLDLDQPLPVPVGPVLHVPVVFTQVGPEAVQELAQAMELDNPKVLLQRFDNGRHCYVGRFEGAIVTYGWVTFDREEIGELNLSIQLKAGEAYIWNCATLPAYRGRRFYPALLVHIIGELQRQGLHRIWIGTDSDNLPSQIGMVIAGFQPIGEIVISRVRTKRRAWMRGRPGALEQLVKDARYALLGEREEIIMDFPTDTSPKFL